MRFRHFSLTVAIAATLGACKPDEPAAEETPSKPTLVTATQQPTAGSQTGGGTMTPIETVLGGADSAASQEDLAAVAAAKAALTFAVFAGANTEITQIRSDLTLPAAYLETSLTWDATPGDVAATGVVTRKAFGLGDTAVALTATITKGLAQDAKVFNLVVLQADPADQDAVGAALLALVESTIKKANDSLLRISGDLELPTSGAYATTISWSSSLAAIAAAGVVTRPTASADGTLTATVTRGGAQGSKSFPVRVLKVQPLVMITEVHAGSDYGWVELHNTTGADVDLSSYYLRTCNNTHDCVSNYAGMLPVFTLKAGAYVTVHFGDSGHASGYFPTTDRDVYSLVTYFLAKNGYIDLRNAANSASIDFVRWRDPTYVSGTAQTRSPLTGTFTGSAALYNANDGTSLQRDFPYDDTDAAADWAWGTAATPGFKNAASATASDSDGDGLSDVYETTLLGTDPTKADTDGDWFTDGQEVLASGINGINLKVLGADPLVRDIFVEVDAMIDPVGGANNLNDITGANSTALRPRKAALDRVVAVFDAYVPDADDNGAARIKLHFDAGSLIPEYDLGGGNAIPFKRCLYFGYGSVDASSVTRSSANCANFYELKTQHFDAARRYVFHHMIFAWSQETNGSLASSGLAEHPGNDIIITVGNWGAGLDETTIVNIQAATILHELGHNLSLDHGGHEAMNYKPSYVSSMNYLYQIDGLDVEDDGKVFYTELSHPTLAYTSAQYWARLGSTAFPIGFSYGTRRTLNEASLDETIGWSVTAGRPVDFNLNNAFTTNVAANVQPTTANTSSTDVLTDHDDWKNLAIRFQEAQSTAANGIGFGSLGLTDADTDDKQPVAKTPCLGFREHF